MQKLNFVETIANELASMTFELIFKLLVAAPPLAQETFQLIEDGGLKEIPKSLDWRNQSTLWYAILALAFSFVLIALSNMGPNKILGIFWRVLYKNNTVEKIVQEEFALKSFSSLLLLLNFVVTTSVLMYLSYLHFKPEAGWGNFYFFLLIPLYFFLWTLLSLMLVGYVTGERQTLSENKKNTMLLVEIAGVFFSILLLVWTFNLKWSTYFVYCFFGLLIFLWLFRLFRGFIFVAAHRVSWYYIGLYILTLEILPLLLVYRMLK